MCVWYNAKKSDWSYTDYFVTYICWSTFKQKLCDCLSSGSLVFTCLNQWPPQTLSGEAWPYSDCLQRPVPWWSEVTRLLQWPSILTLRACPAIVSFTFVCLLFNVQWLMWYILYYSVTHDLLFYYYLWHSYSDIFFNHWYLWENIIPDWLMQCNISEKVICWLNLWLSIISVGWLWS